MLRPFVLLLICCSVGLTGCGQPPTPRVLVQDGPASEPPDPELVPTLPSEDDGLGVPPTDQEPPDEPDEPPDGPPDEPDEPPDEPDELENCPFVRVDVAAGNTLNVRSTPTTEDAPIATLSDGAVVSVVDIVEGQAVNAITTWYQVALLDDAGFVSGAFVQCTQDAPPEFDGFRLPLPCDTTMRIAQGNFGAFSHSGRSRYAYDFAIPVDTPMVAMAAGVVSALYDDTGPGDDCYDGGGESCFPQANYVELYHPDGSASIYKHLNRVDVSVGEAVVSGQQIGLSGSTGYSTGPHAHVMRQEQCGNAIGCESLPLIFLDVEGDGEPETDAWVTSGNCL